MRSKKIVIRNTEQFLLAASTVGLSDKDVQEVQEHVMKHAHAGIVYCQLPTCTMKSLTWKTFNVLFIEWRDSSAIDIVDLNEDTLPPPPPSRDVTDFLRKLLKKFLISQILREAWERFDDFIGHSDRSAEQMRREVNVIKSKGHLNGLADRAAEIEGRWTCTAVQGTNLPLHDLLGESSMEALVTKKHYQPQLPPVISVGSSYSLQELGSRGIIKTIQPTESNQSYLLGGEKKDFEPNGIDLLLLPKASYRKNVSCKMVTWKHVQEEARLLNDALYLKNKRTEVALLVSKLYERCRGNDVSKEAAEYLSLYKRIHKCTNKRYLSWGHRTHRYQAQLIGRE